MRKQANSSRGFSLIEALIVVTIALVMMAIAVPSAMQAYRTYQLNSAASRVSGMLKYTRLEAIRENRPVNFLMQPVGGGPTMQIWTDEPTTASPTGDGVMQTSEKQTLLTSSATVMPLAGVPATGAIAAAVGVANLTAVPVAGGLDTLTFDGRGAMASPPAVYAICIQNTGLAAAGYRAVILMPSGSVQTWMSDAAGNWQRAN
ncbi:MAG: pilus assembly FimT family protein [Terriglobales bacterium]